MKTNYLIILFVFFTAFFTGCGKDEGIKFDTIDDNRGENSYPSIRSQTFTVSSSIGSEEVIGVMIASDPDGDELSFEIVEDQNELFEITNKGELSLIDGKSLGNSPSFTIKVSVFDGELKATATIIIEHLFENREPEINAQVFEVYETIRSEEIIGIVEATDLDEDDLLFAILENSGDLFEISGDGIVGLKEGKSLSANEMDSHEITVEVSDGELRSSAVMTILVEEVTDAAFITKWIVDDGEEVMLPLYPGTETSYDFTVYWGDGTKSEVTSFDDVDARHIYELSGTYSIIITGTLRGFSFGKTNYSRNNIIDVAQWGDVFIGNDGYIFSNCRSLKGFSATDAPDLSEITNLSGFFNNATYETGEIDHWDVSNVEDMSDMFRFSNFNQAIGSWEVSKVTTMERMFNFSTFNQDIGDWDVSNVENMALMFYVSSFFNWDIRDWNVSSVKNMSFMFSYSDFNSPIGNWDVSSVEDMSSMFWGSDFDWDLDEWDVSNVLNMSEMFAFSDFNGDISTWEVVSVLSMSKMFHEAEEFNQDLSAWEVGSVVNMDLMFYGADEFDQDLSNWDTSNLTSCYNFINAYTSPMTADQLPVPDACF